MMVPVFVVCTGGTATSPIVVMGREEAGGSAAADVYISVYTFNMGRA